MNRHILIEAINNGNLDILKWSLENGCVYGKELYKFSKECEKFHIVKWFEEIGNKPQDGQKWSVGRIDNNGWYTYGNIRWELDNSQARNHTKQKNNTTGVTGLGIQTKIIAENSYTSWIAQWKSLDGKSCSKNFSTNKYGYEEAKQLAIAYRTKMIQELNKQGAGYAESHGSEK